MAAFLENIAPFTGNGKKNDKGQDLEEFLEEYDPYKYKNPCVTTDAVCVFCRKGRIDLRIQQKNYSVFPGSIIVIFGGLLCDACHCGIFDRIICGFPAEQKTEF